MVKNSRLEKQVDIKGATIPGIMDVIFHAETKGAEFITEDFIRSIGGRSFKDTMRKLWSKLRSEIRYQADGRSQVVKSPGALWKSKVGDCKSFAVFVAAVLDKMGEPYKLVLDRYDSSRPNLGHIYVVSNGVIIDPVHSVFNFSDPAYKREFFENGAAVTGTGKKSLITSIIILLYIYLYE